MNVRPGGAQPKMRDTVWAGMVQKMTLADETPKGSKLVLEERGIDTATLNADDMCTPFRFITILEPRGHAWRSSF